MLLFMLRAVESWDKVPRNTKPFRLCWHERSLSFINL